MPLGGIELTPFQVAQVCYRCGLDPDAGKGLYIVNAICVAFGESSFFTGAWNFNTSTGDKSYGLWQINMIEPIGAERRTQFKLAHNEELYKADVNCKIMLKMSNGGKNFKPWGAYTNGSYRAAMGVALQARTQLLQTLSRPVSAVPIPPEPPPQPMAERSWVSFKQIKAAALSATGIYKTKDGDSSRDDVAKFQRGLWKLQPKLTYIYHPGIYDVKTRQACASFQRAQGWSGREADGIVGPETLKRVAAKSQLFRARDW